MKRRYQLIMMMLLLLYSANGYCDKSKKKKVAMPPMPPALVVVDPVVEVRDSVVRSYIGSVQAAEEVDLQARVSGNITGIKFKEGSLVKKGDLLFTLEDVTYKADALAAKAEVDQAKAELEYAESNYERQKLLQDKKVVSTSALEDAERLVKFKRAKFEQVDAKLLKAENDLSYTKIYAPITGRIGKVKYTAGNYVSLDSDALVKIVSVDPILVKFSLSERIYQNLLNQVASSYENLKITIKLSNGDLYPEKGRIAFVDNVVDKSTGTISVWVKFKNPDMRLIPGGYVRALLSEDKIKPIPGVKVSAVITDNRGSFVYILGKNNIPIRKNIKLGEQVGNLYTIKKGLKPGDVVITDGTHKVIPGMPVKPVPATTTEN